MGGRISFQLSDDLAAAMALAGVIDDADQDNSTALSGAVLRLIERTLLGDRPSNDCPSDGVAAAAARMLGVEVEAGGLVGRKGAAEMLGVAPKTLSNRNGVDQPLRPVRRGRAVFYRLSEVAALKARRDKSLDSSHASRTAGVRRGTLTT